MEFCKPDISTHDVAEIVSMYPFGEMIHFVDLGGIPNLTYKVTTPSDKFVIRIYGQGQSSQEHIKLEHNVLAHLEKCSFPSPRLISGHNGKVLQNWRGYWVCAMRYIPGVTADKVEITPGLARNIGRLIANFKKAMLLSTIKVPKGETFIDRGLFVLAALPAALKRRGWNMDITNVLCQWERASHSFVVNVDVLPSNIIHADIWPPNVLCKDEQVTGLVDFDDCCHGASIIDLSLALMEFSMFNGTTMNEKIVHGILYGYFEQGGKITGVENDVIVDAMEMACAMWLAYNVVESPVYDDAAVYLKRLNLLQNDNYKGNLKENIQNIIDDAKRQVVSDHFDSRDTDEGELI